MSAAQARMEVEREMGRRYGGNPWDEPGPGPRRMMEERREREMREERREREMREREREEEERRQRERAEEKTEPVYSASEWDHFERSLGYK